VENDLFQLRVSFNQAQYVIVQGVIIPFHAIVSRFKVRQSVMHADRETRTASFFDSRPDIRQHQKPGREADCEPPEDTPPVFEAVDVVAAFIPCAPAEAAVLLCSTPTGKLKVTFDGPVENGAVTVVGFEPCRFQKYHATPTVTPIPNIQPQRFIDFPYRLKRKDSPSLLSSGLQSYSLRSLRLKTGTAPPERTR
jgi:hypothetical protein